MVRVTLKDTHKLVSRHITFAREIGWNFHSDATKTKFIMEISGVEVYILNNNDLTKFDSVIINNHNCITKNYDNSFEWCGKNLCNVSNRKNSQPTKLGIDKPSYKPVRIKKTTLICEDTGKDIVTKKVFYKKMMPYIALPSFSSIANNASIIEANTTSTNNALNSTSQPSTSSSFNFAPQPSTSSSLNSTSQPSTSSSFNFAPQPSTSSSLNSTPQPSTNSSLNFAHQPSTNSSLNSTLQPSTNSSFNFAPQPSTNSSLNFAHQPSTNSSFNFAPPSSTNSSFNFAPPSSTNSSFNFTPPSSTNSSFNFAHQPSNSSNIASPSNIHSSASQPNTPLSTNSTVNTSRNFDFGYTPPSFATFRNEAINLTNSNQSTDSESSPNDISFLADHWIPKLQNMN
jgi:hypothetical protein